MVVTVHPIDVYKMALPDNFWFPFLDQPQSYVVIFAIIYFYIYKYIVKEWNHIISINDIVTFNESLENFSMPIVELKSIEDSTQEYRIVILNITLFGKK